MKQILTLKCIVLSMAFGIHPAPTLAADEFPSRPITVIVPYALGGATDNLARLLAKKISENIGEPVIVENKPGATGMIAGEFLSRATPDGQTISKLRAVAMLGTERSKVLPDVPTFAELGFKGLSTPWLGIFAPAGTPPAIIKRLNAEFLNAIQDPQVRERMDAQAFEPVGSSPEAFRKFLDEELAANGKLIRDTGIKPD